MEGYEYGAIAPGDSKDAYFCTERDIKDYYVAFEELAEMVEWVWTVSAPGGQLLTKQEQKEAYERFKSWQRTGRYWEQEIDGDSRLAKAMGKNLDPSRPVSFLEFKRWFLHLATYLEHLRNAVVLRDDTPTMPLLSSEENESVNVLEPLFADVARSENQDFTVPVVPEETFQKEKPGREHEKEEKEKEEEEEVNEEKAEVKLGREEEKEEVKEEETEEVHYSILPEPRSGMHLP